MSEDMSSYCSAHDEWLIMKLCMYVGYHDSNNDDDDDDDDDGDGVGDDDDDDELSKYAFLIAHP